MKTNTTHSNQKMSVSVIIITLNEFESIGQVLKEKKNAGTYTLSWDAKNMSSGMYFIQIKAGSFTKIRKCLLIK